MSNTTSSSGGIGCLTVLGLIFVTLKLTGNIDWSWWWVLSPFLFQGVVLFVLLLTAFAFLIIPKR
jgi:hypothetical protein